MRSSSLPSDRRAMFLRLTRTSWWRWSKAGPTPQEILAAAVEAAALIGRRDLGEIAIGAAADFVVVDGDPLKNPELLARPALVQKAGREP
jgi:imidazolonepropionase-like amidohydrolase